MYVETNRLVLSGAAERVFVCEIPPNSILVANDQRVTKVQPFGFLKVRIYTANGESFYYRADSTLLIKTHKTHRG